MKGWIDEVDDGIIYGRVMDGTRECGFWIPLLNVMESQRVDLQPGSWVTIVNGQLVVESVMWTTHDMEAADREAEELHRALFPCPQENASDPD